MIYTVCFRVRGRGAAHLAYHKEGGDAPPPSIDELFAQKAFFIEKKVLKALFHFNSQPIDNFANLKGPCIIILISVLCCKAFHFNCTPTSFSNLPIYVLRFVLLMC